MLALGLALAQYHFAWYDVGTGPTARVDVVAALVGDMGEEIAGTQASSVAGMSFSHCNGLL